MRETIVSRCEREFVYKALTENIRLDGRKLLEARKLKLYFGKKWGRCVASLGQTKVVVNVSCSIQPPKMSRPNEGKVFINFELNPLVAPHFEAGRQTDCSVLITRQLERCFKESRCIDLESLCIIANKYVWDIRIDVNVINHDGNLIDCASMATLAALSHFHCPDITIDGEEILIHELEKRNPLPLRLLHHPICVSFTTFENGKTVMDPTYLEERLGLTQLTLSLNGYHELCGFTTSRTCTKTATDVMSTVMNDAAKYAAGIVKQILDTVEFDVQARYNVDIKGMQINRLNNMIAKDKITSMITERINIKISNWDAANKIETNKDVEEIKMSVDESPDCTVIRKLGAGSAELISSVPKMQVGEGGPSTWSNSESSDDDKMDDIKIIDEKKTEQIIIDNIAMSDSEEETTKIISTSDLI